MKEYKNLCKKMVGLEELVEMMGNHISDFDDSYTVTIQSPTTSNLEYDVSFNINGFIEHLVIRANKVDGGMMFQLGYKDEGLKSLASTLLVQEIVDNERVFEIRKTLEKLIQFEKDNGVLVTVGTEPLTIEFDYKKKNYYMAIQDEGVVDFIVQDKEEVDEDYIEELENELAIIEEEISNFENQIRPHKSRAIEIRKELNEMGINC